MYPKKMEQRLESKDDPCVYEKLKAIQTSDHVRFTWVFSGNEAGRRRD